MADYFAPSYQLRDAPYRPGELGITPELARAIRYDQDLDRAGEEVRYFVHPTRPSEFPVLVLAVHRVGTGDEYAYASLVKIGGIKRRFLVSETPVATVAATHYAAAIRDWVTADAGSVAVDAGEKE